MTSISLLRRTERYHELFAELIKKWFTSDELFSMIEDTSEMLRPYVEKDPTKFCTVEDFEKGVSALSEFVTLRAEAVSRQLRGDNTSVDTADLIHLPLGKATDKATHALEKT